MESPTAVVVSLSGEPHSEESSDPSEEPIEDIQANKEQPKIVIKDPEAMQAPMEYESEFDTDYPSAEESQSQEAKDPPVVYERPAQNLPAQNLTTATIEESPFAVSYEPIEEDSISADDIEEIETESEEVEDSLQGIVLSLLNRLKEDSILTIFAVFLGIIIVLSVVLVQIM